MKKALKIRKYQSGDYEDLCGLFLGFQNYLAETDTKKICRPFNDFNETKKYADQSIIDVQKMEGVLFVAELGGKIIGFIQGIVDRHQHDVLYKLSHKEGDHGWVGELYVCPEFRGRGIAKKLMAKIEDHFRKQGCVGVRLFVMADNTVARKTYQKLGFDERDLELAKDL